MQTARSRRLISLALIGSFFLFRFANIGALPMFSDEAMSAHITSLLNDNLWITFESESKKPLTFWLTYPLYRLFPDPLISCRFASVLFGFLAFLATFILALRLFDFRVAVYTAFLYVACPYVVFHERLFLQDHLVNFFVTIFLILLIGAVKDKKLNSYIFAGIALGLGALSKETALMILVTIPFVPFISSEKRLSKKILLPVFLSVAIPFFISLIPHLKFGTKLWHFSTQNEYLLSAKKLFSFPFSIWFSNTKTVLGWYIFYFGPLLVVAFWGVIHSVKNRKREPIFLAMCIAIVLLTLIISGNRFYSRYVLFLVPPVLILSAWTFLNVIKEKNINLFLVVMVTSYFLFFDFLAIFHPSLLPLPKDDREQYITGWASGYGFDEVRRWFEDKSKSQQINIFLPAVKGHPTDAMFIYFDNKENVGLHIAWWIIEKPIMQGGCVRTLINPHLKREFKTVCFEEIKNAYLVLDIPQFSIEPILKLNPNMKLELLVKKPADKSAFAIFNLR